MIDDRKLKEKAAIKALLNLLPEKWTSVREKSLTMIFKEAGISPHQGRKVLDVMTSLRYYEEKDPEDTSRAGIRYRMPKDVANIDKDRLTDDILAAIHNKKIYSGRASFIAGTPRSNKRQRYSGAGSAPGKVLSFPRFIPGDEIYLMFQNTPHKGIIIKTVGKFTGEKDASPTLERIIYQVAIGWDGTYPIENHKEKTDTSKVFATKELLLDRFNFDLKRL